MYLTVYSSNIPFTVLSLVEEIEFEMGSDRDAFSSPELVSPASSQPQTPVSRPSESPLSRTGSTGSAGSTETREEPAVFGGKTGLKSGTFLKHTFLDHYQPWELSGFEDYDFCHNMLSTLQ